MNHFEIKSGIPKLIPESIRPHGLGGTLPSSYLGGFLSRQVEQGIESDHFRVKKNMPKVGGFRSFNSARRTIAGFEAMLWLKKGFDFTGQWIVREHNDLLAVIFGIDKVNEA